MIADHSTVMALFTFPRRPHAGIAAVLTLTYIVLALLVSEPVKLIALWGVALVVSALARLPWRAYAGLALCVALFPVVGHFSWFIIEPSYGWISLLVVGFFRVALMSQAITLLGATTDLGALMRLVPARVPGVRAFGFLCATTLAILPSIQRDLRRAMDAVWLRRGIRRWPLGPAAWGDILTDTLTRTITRGEWLAGEVADRGFRLRRGLRRLPGEAPQWWDYVALVVGLGAAVALWMARV